MSWASRHLVLLPPLFPHPEMLQEERAQLQPVDARSSELAVCANAKQGSGDICSGDNAWVAGHPAGAPHERAGGGDLRGSGGGGVAVLIGQRQLPAPLQRHCLVYVDRGVRAPQAPRPVRMDPSVGPRETHKADVIDCLASKRSCSCSIGGCTIRSGAVCMKLLSGSRCTR